ncbi:hypothetical protein FSP39_017482 [Pinctada imbricata]|uniref:C3H1-type domain-containing protein n=1 Tax=Pinctada imbricata TaxID=66713 RepID=A0AA89C0A4_PINIB|nr:hypothetical protein FSP39_017482 [Pinctada imbricata]
MPIPRRLNTRNITVPRGRQHNPGDDNDVNPPPRTQDVQTVPPTSATCISDDQINVITTRITERVLDKLTSPANEDMERHIGNDIIPIHDANNAGNELTNSNIIEMHDPNNIDYQVPSISNDLGYNLSNKTKLKIVNGEYVDLGLSISKPANVEDGSKKLSVENGRIVIADNKSDTKINNIQQWTDAFLVYSSVYATAHPSSFAGLLKYMHTVRLGASRTSGLGRKNYDIQFRLKREQNPALSWSVVDQELWLMYMYYNSSGNNDITTSTSSNKCYDFNYKGSCQRYNCPYLHSCIKCSLFHPHIRCKGFQNVNSRFATQQSRFNRQPTRSAKQLGNQQNRFNTN